MPWNFLRRGPRRINHILGIFSILKFNSFLEAPKELFHVVSFRIFITGDNEVSYSFYFSFKINDKILPYCTDDDDKRLTDVDNLVVVEYQLLTDAGSKACK